MSAVGFQWSKDLPHTLYVHATGSQQCRLIYLKGEHVFSFETATAWVRRDSDRKCLTYLCAGSPIVHEWQCGGFLNDATIRISGEYPFSLLNSSGLRLGLILLCSSQKHVENLGRQEMLVLITVACKRLP